MRIHSNLFKSIKRGGFSLMEVLVYVAIFAAIGTFLVGILSTILNIETKQSSQNQLSEQIAFVSDTVKRMVEGSSLIDIPTTTQTSTLRLRMPLGNEDPTTLFASGGIFYIQQGSDPLLPLTDASIVIDSLSFRRHQNSAGPNVLEYSISLSNNVTNPRGRSTRSLKTAIVHTHAATFDSDLVPDASSRRLGNNSATTWQKLFVGDGDATAPALTFGNASDVGLFKVSGQDILGLTTNGAERMRIDASGNIGINDSTPGVRLDITGDFRVTGIPDGGSGNLVCVKADDTLGTCNASVTAGGNCTCL